MMKFVVSLCFAVGLLVGWCLPGNSGISALAIDPVHDPASRTLDPETDDLATSIPAIRLTRENVEISQERLMALLEMPGSTALSVREFIGRDTGWGLGSLERLATWSGLDDLERRQLDEIVRQAAATRKQWEMANVTVTSQNPGHWTLDFPGDEGLARAELKRAIVEALGPEKAEAIDAAGNLNDFFGFGTIAPEFRNGRVEISAMRVGRNDQPDPAARNLLIECDIDGRHISISSMLPAYHSSVETAVFKELLGWDGLPGTAGLTTEAEAGKE